MAEIRQFGTEISSPIPTPGVEGVQATVIQLPAQIAGLLSQAELAERYQGLPLIVDRPVSVAAEQVGLDLSRHLVLAGLAGHHHGKCQPALL